MKKCPKCKAEIQDEARFCLYCMTSFEEKQAVKAKNKRNKQRLYYTVSAVLAVMLAIISIFIFKPKGSGFNNLNNNSVNSSFTDNTGMASSERQGNAGVDYEASFSDNSQALNSQNGITDNTSENTATDNPFTNSDPQNNTSANNKTANSPSGNLPTGNEAPGDAFGNNSGPKYSYIEATIENTYPTGDIPMYAPEDAIVITKVNYKEEDGNYVIPDTVDGKKVAAIMPDAFGDSYISSSVKSVTLPYTVRAIWGNAFNNCFNLTDLYIKSLAIEICEDAFPTSDSRNGKITIHCNKDCRNFNYKHYRNIAYKYDAEYEEWNG